MTERELEARLIHEQIPLPNGFDARQEAALCRAMAQTRGVAHRPKRTLLLAAALMLLTGAAFAAGGRGLAFFWRQASPEAERLIERGIAQSGGRLDAAEFVVREAVFDGSTLQAVVVIRAENGRRAVMLGQNGNVSRDAVLVDIGETGDVAWAEDEDGALLVYISQTVRDAGETLHVAWPCSAAVADADGLHWAKPQTGMLEFDVPRVQSQSFAMQTSVGWAEWLTVTGIRVSTTPLGMALEIDYRPSTRLGEALPEFVVEDDERVINRHGELSRTGDAQTGYTVCMQTDLPSSLPHALTLGVRGLDESIRFDFDTQTAAMTKGAER